VEMAPHVAQLYRDVEMIIDEVANAETLSGVVSLKSHDSYTYEHSIEVTVAGVMLGQRLHLSSNDIRQLALGCLCHDIGKTIVPPEILAKPDRLTPEEFALVKQHPQAGYDTMRQITGEDAVIARSVVWQHHERQDGTGYPRGLRGTNEFQYPSPPRFGQWLMVPAAEIAAVADVYSALASDRPYRPALEISDVIATLQKMAGPHLNRELVKRFLSMLPTYPVGSEVVVITGRLQGHRGIVTEVSASDIHRPIVRILFDPEGNKVTPFVVDTRVERDVELAAPSYTKLAPAR